jgi:hypothetical protein
VLRLPATQHRTDRAVGTAVAKAELRVPLVLEHGKEDVLSEGVLEKVESPARELVRGELPAALWDPQRSEPAKWTPLALEVDEARATAPVHVILGEAVDVASMLSHYWEPKADAKGARIRSTLEFLFDDDVQDDADTQLENLRAAFADSASQDAMALALEGYAELASKHQEKLTDIEGFDVALVDEARTLAAALRQQSAVALTHTTLDAQRQALGLRNRLLLLLIDRVKRVRRAAAYVFRNQPDIIRKFTSTYERRQRSARDADRY